MNGIFDASENGFPNIPIEARLMVNGVATQTLTAVTNEKGQYAFENLPAGTYVVAFPILNSFVFAARDTGTDDTVDSDVDPFTGETDLLGIPADTVVENIDAGVFVPDDLGFDLE